MLSEKTATLGHLVAGVAHEMNRPLGAIEAAARAIRDGFESRLLPLVETGIALGPPALSLLAEASSRCG